MGYDPFDPGAKGVPSGLVGPLLWVATPILCVAGTPLSAEEPIL